MKLNPRTCCIFSFLAFTLVGLPVTLLFIPMLITSLVDSIAGGRLIETFVFTVLTTLFTLAFAVFLSWDAVCLFYFRFLGDSPPEPKEQVIPTYIITPRPRSMGKHNLLGN